MSTFKEMITVEKEVYEAVLRNSVRVNDLEAENQQLKGLLRECREVLELVVYSNSSNFASPTYGAEYLLPKITNAIGEKK